ncbi:hypothetical protein MKX01_037826 [Papaver californicum]|nr:hypothetical protein MKX01_037826 [Papaver californicum]
MGRKKKTRVSEESEEEIQEDVSQSSSSKDKSLYEILGVEKMASQQGIKRHTISWHCVFIQRRTLMMRKQKRNFSNCKRNLHVMLLKTCKIDETKPPTDPLRRKKKFNKLPKKESENLLAVITQRRGQRKEQFDSMFLSMVSRYSGSKS